jgi:hemoglobin
VSAETRINRTIVIDGVPLPDLLDEETVRQVVFQFYDKVRDDALLAPIFYREIEPDEWPRHLQKMCDFWSATLLRTDRFEGRPLPAHLALPELEEAHFRRWLQLFSATTRQVCTPDVAALFMNRALRIAHSFRLAIAFHRGQSTLDIEPILEDSL